MLPVHCSRRYRCRACTAASLIIGGAQRAQPRVCSKLAQHSMALMQGILTIINGKGLSAFTYNHNLAPRQHVSAALHC